MFLGIKNITVELKIWILSLEDIVEELFQKVKQNDKDGKQQRKIIKLEDEFRKLISM